MNVTGIILAGGKSSRMGAEKGVQLLHGEALISYSIKALSGLCDTILISSDSDTYNNFGFQVVADQFPGIGPMGGIYSCLKQSTSEVNLVLSCDLPFVTGELFSYILSNSQGYDVAIPWLGGRHYEPLCGFYHLSTMRMIEKYILSGNYKLPDMFENININKLIIDKELGFYNENLFSNINCKRDLLDAEEKMNYRG